MSLNESIVEDACLAMPKATLTPALSQVEREKREAIRRLNPAIACGNPHPASPKGRGEEARATLRKFRIVPTERRTNS